MQPAKTKSDTGARRRKTVYYTQEDIIEPRVLLPIEVALMVAARAGNVDAAYTCVLNGADINCHKDDGVTPLFVAAEAGQRRMVHFLVTQPGIKPNAIGTFGRTPIWAAATYGFLSATKMLLRHHADPNIGDTFGKTPLLNSIRACNLPMTTLLVRHGADVNQPDDFGNMPLYIAMIEVNDPDQSRFLLRNGALPNLRGPRGNAIIENCIFDLDPDIQNEVVHMLIRYGGRVNLGNPLTYKTPLHSCAFYNNIEMTRFLLTMGANPKAASHNGITPMNIAAEEKNWDVYDLLEEAIYRMDYFNENYVSVAKANSSIAFGRMNSIIKQTSGKGAKMQSQSRVRFSRAVDARTKLVRSNSNVRAGKLRRPSRTSSKIGRGKSEKLKSSKGTKQDSTKRDKPIVLTTMRDEIPKGYKIKRY